MNPAVKKTLYIALLLCLAALLTFIVISRAALSYAEGPQIADTFPPEPTLTPTATPSPEPTDELYTLTFVGDNTIANSNLSAHFDSIVKGNMDYCYANVKQYFAEDDMTFGNLECILSDSRLGSSSMFHFKAPTKNAQMLVNGGFEYVTTANNHTLDYGSTGLKDTLSALDSAGIAYGTDGKYNIYETKSGLKIGIYCGYQSYQLSSDRALAIVGDLKAQGAEYIIFALHWGDEGVYRPSEYQKRLAHNYIDAGVDLVYGSHPHVLQPVEEYGDGLIIYSMGNFCFGGNSGPRDKDSAIVQVTLCRDASGKIALRGFELIPCCISSTVSFNDYCPTPYKAGTAEYERTMSKLKATYTGPDIRPDYSFMNKESPEPTASPTAAPDSTESPEPAETPVQTEVIETAPPESPADEAEDPPEQSAQE